MARKEVYRQRREVRLQQRKEARELESQQRKLSRLQQRNAQPKAPLAPPQNPPQVSPPLMTTETENTPDAVAARKRYSPAPANTGVSTQETISRLQQLKAPSAPKQASPLLASTADENALVAITRKKNSPAPISTEVSSQETIAAGLPRENLKLQKHALDVAIAYVFVETLDYPPQEQWAGKDVIVSNICKILGIGEDSKRVVNTVLEDVAASHEENEVYLGESDTESLEDQSIADGTEDDFDFEQATATALFNLHR
jgi:hypothetical protein